MVQSLLVAVLSACGQGDSGIRPGGNVGPPSQEHSHGYTSEEQASRALAAQWIDRERSDASDATRQFELLEGVHARMPKSGAISCVRTGGSLLVSLVQWSGEKAVGRQLEVPFQRDADVRSSNVRMSIRPVSGRELRELWGACDYIRFAFISENSVNAQSDEPLSYERGGEVNRVVWLSSPELSWPQYWTTLPWGARRGSVEVPESVVEDAIAGLMESFVAEGSSESPDDGRKWEKALVAMLESIHDFEWGKLDLNDRIVAAAALRGLCATNSGPGRLAANKFLRYLRMSECADKRLRAAAESAVEWLSR